MREKPLWPPWQAKINSGMTASPDNAHLPERTPNPSSGSPSHFSSSSAIRSLEIAGPTGRLEALLNEGRADAPYATLICHPHPLGGGTMHNKVVYHAAKVFSARGWPVLRFNFRGTGLSEGTHDGKAEVDDVRAALDWLVAQYNKPIVAAGFSFGAAMGLKASCIYPGIHGFAALGLPTHAEGRDYRYGFLSGCAFPKLFLSGDRDQFAPAAQLRAIVDSAADPKQFVLIPNADHFFTGHLPAMQTPLRQWLYGTFPNSSKPGDSAQ
jgi:alpha/beta superfamily hydrolase